MKSSRAVMQNPYAPPLSASASRPATGLPLYMSNRTSRIVNRFGLFELIAWVLVGFWTDRFFLDLFALFIATNGARLRATSCRSFPWTAIMCAVYPIIFLFNITRVDITVFSNWLPYRDSPVLPLQLIVAVWGALAAGALLQCYMYQNSQQVATEPSPRDLAEPSAEARHSLLERLPAGVPPTAPPERPDCG